jgi:prepilin-type N-terminal cleavage/methylation domain-containing protein
LLRNALLINVAIGDELQATSTQLNIKPKQDDTVKLLRIFKCSKGFTFVELLTSIAIIGILGAVGIQQYSQYKVRGYDAHSKQALHDMNLTCKAYWTVNETSDECDLIKAKEFGFVENSDVVATLPSSPLDTFCASAKHDSSPNTFSSDSAGLISDNEDCGTGLAAKRAAKAEAERIAAEKAVAELESAIKQAAREDCCIEVKWKSAEQSGEYNRRLKASGCPYQTSEIVEACRVYFFDAEVANRRDPSIPNCPRIRFQFHSRNRIDALATVVIKGVTVPAEGIHASQFDIDNPDSECARNL